jgi:predicted Zn-dependent peptidase
VDAGLFEITARVKKVEDMDYVRERILETVKAFQEKPVDAARLDTVRKRLRYQVALSMDNSDTIAQILSYYVALKRTPETMNALYDRYATLTPEDVRQAAAKYLVEKGRTIVTLTGPGGAKMPVARNCKGGAGFSLPTPACGRAFPRCCSSPPARRRRFAPWRCPGNRRW